MSNGRLSEVSAICHGELIGDDQTFTGISTDTRSMKANDLFVCLTGPNFNGHDFLDQAQQLGAAGFVVSEPARENVPRVVVQDTRKALGDIAAAWRRRFAIPVAAITGSNGKTSTKEMLAAILRVNHETIATRGNMNNDIGVPLTLLGLNSRTEAAVIEMGSNAPGEIGNLAEMTMATVGVITNASSAHLEKLGDLQGVAQEKGALLASLDAESTAIINADDEFAEYWKELSGTAKIYTFGASENADFRFSNLSQFVNGSSASLKFTLTTPEGDCRVTVPVAGAHNAINAVAAAAAAHAMGIELEVIKEGLSQANGIAGRMQIQTATCGARLIDDSYNANPESAVAAMQFLADQKEPGWLVLGDMGELGSNAPDMHASLGKHARELGIARVFAVGKLSRAAVAAFGEGAKWFESTEDLQKALAKELQIGTNVLIKGSRSMRLEEVTQFLQRAPQTTEHPEANSC